ncbi:hypothetical protein LSH36_140g05040 [Paralvinella palmiformis]|uniref:Uncharacterized protein n=1 Tax=Paralvinella palmiformis TaxID=53620 RepID=A0AAD9JVQ3_9ANNE|nr:hypothetical protein LSH36_140g05040 [Paralvinella palmiformis]
MSAVMPSFDGNKLKRRLCLCQNMSVEFGKPIHSLNRAIKLSCSEQYAFVHFIIIVNNNSNNTYNNDDYVDLIKCPYC